MTIVSEEIFKKEIIKKLKGTKAKSVTGKGRSGAVASVYASHILKIPFIPYGQKCPDKLKPILVIDTAIHKGNTLKKAMRKYNTKLSLAVLKEPPVVRFWYEV